MAVNATVKISSPTTRQFWEIPVLFEDEHLLALNKPPLLLTSPDRHDPRQPNLISLVHQGIERGVPWAKERHLIYLMNAHRLDFETSGVLLLAKSKPVLLSLANLFGSEKIRRTWVALIPGSPTEDSFALEAKIAPNPTKSGQMRVDPKLGKRAKTEFQVRERFWGYTLLECRPVTSRIHQVRVHLRHLGWPILGDSLYGGGPLLLSDLKSVYRLKPNKTERPLISDPALHAEEFSFSHPMTGNSVKINAPWPKDLAVAIKYLRRFSVENS